jgi:hypothetical protein
MVVWTEKLEKGATTGIATGRLRTRPGFPLSPGSIRMSLSRQGSRATQCSEEPQEETTACDDSLRTMYVLSQSGVTDTVIGAMMVEGHCWAYPGSLYICLYEGGLLRRDGAEDRAKWIE